MRNLISIFAGKITHWIVSQFKLGAGGTWPGEIVLTISPHILVQLFKQLNRGVIIVAGTNGKTTTSLMIKKILEAQGQKVIHNDTGANLLNGIVSAFIQKATWLGKIDADWGVFETDENSLPILLAKLRTKNKELRTIIVLLNLFRDQLDRYGEVDVIAEKWERALEVISHQMSDIGQFGNVTLVLNADDPLIAHLGKTIKPLLTSPLIKGRQGGVTFFGVNDKKYFLKQKEHATDSIFCLNCGGRLDYSGIYYSHIGIWKCEQCGEERPKPDITEWKSPLPGLYNRYNTLAAVSVARALDIDHKTISQALHQFAPAFGRQEEFDVDDKKVKIFLSKNPAGFNASLRTVLELNPKVMLLVLNDRIPDGRDVSWIWDVDFEMIPENVRVMVSGDRAYDMAVRMKYSVKSQKSKVKSQNDNSKFKNLIIEPDLGNAIRLSIDTISERETLYILPTYSAMLEVRKILTGRKIL